MAKYDVYYAKADKTLLVDCQADILELLDTRVVVPLLPVADAPKPAKHLNPLIELGGESYVMATQFLASVSVRDFGDKIATLSDRSDDVNRALDTLITGF